LISYDHHTSDDAEVKRLEDMGTEFYCVGDNELRVEGMINVTRTLGDYQLKPYGVTYEPYVTRREITENTPYIIVASDGLWDKVKSDTAYEIVTEAENTGEAAKNLLARALKDRTRDNVSIFVIKF
jgi:serine/threonine protein phosphatase PrpC